MTSPTCSENIVPTAVGTLIKKSGRPLKIAKDGFNGKTTRLRKLHPPRNGRRPICNKLKGLSAKVLTWWASKPCHQLNGMTESLILKKLSRLYFLRGH